MSDERILNKRMEISDLIQGWMLRDLGEWSRLRTLFHLDGTIDVTWFEGQFSDFVEASTRMAASALRTKHLIGTPVMTIKSDKAICETNVVIVCENSSLHLGCTEHARFYDRIERRAGSWRILSRCCFYDMGALTSPYKAIEIDEALVERHPIEYAALAYVLDKSGFPVRGAFPTRGSESERQIKEVAQSWL